MNWSPPVHASLDVVQPITVYRVIGRRPSAVFVDEQHEATGKQITSGNRLWDRVFLRTEAEPGDQIEERTGGMVLITREGECHPVQLSIPEARRLETAFTHTDQVVAADHALAEQLLAEGRLTAGSKRRQQQHYRRNNAQQPTPVKFAEDHPLIVEALPD